MNVITNLLKQENVCYHDCKERGGKSRLPQLQDPEEKISLIDPIQTVGDGVTPINVTIITKISYFILKTNKAIDVICGKST